MFYEYLEFLLIIWKNLHLNVKLRYLKIKNNNTSDRMYYMLIMLIELLEVLNTSIQQT